MMMFNRKLRALGSRLLAPLRTRVRAEIERALQREIRDIRSELQRNALQTTAAYVQHRMMHIDPQESGFDLLTLATQHVNAGSGLYLEFGVYQGSSINHIATTTSQIVFGFDAFQGLPERWRPGFDAGAFRVDTLPSVAPNVRLIEGWFHETLPGFLAEHREKVAFLHVDCDLYSSTNTVLSCLRDRFQPGSVIVFDEYFNFPGWEEGEFKAFQEFILAEGWSYEYLSYNCLHEQVAVRLTSQNRPSA